MPFVIVLLLALTATGCASGTKELLGRDTELTFTRIFRTDFETAWQGALEALKRNRFEITDRESGFIQTKWTDNTAERNLVDSFGSADSYLKAQYRLKVTVRRGFYEGSPSAKVTVLREQLVERDVLEGWRPVATDAIEEKTLLYRMGRIIIIRTRLARLEAQKAKAAARQMGAGGRQSFDAAPDTLDTDSFDNLDESEFEEL